MIESKLNSLLNKKENHVITIEKHE